ncbi:MAG: glycine cleavage system protein GcvH [Alphaproteobacteria bacterium]|nr:glycine cleavage system protein GcvH [Alphaproteobacteria bacterium]
MSNIRYSEDHEWITVEGDIGTIGISNFAQEQLGDVVFIELPDIGKTVSPDDEAAVVESVKAASEIYSPVKGEVVEVNEGLVDEPGAVNGDPLGGGWFFKIKISDPAQLEALMDDAAYAEFIKEHG